MIRPGLPQVATPTLPHVRLSLASHCNFRCTYCPPWGENSYSGHGRLSTEGVLLLMDALADAGFQVIKFTGGEPTLRRDLLRIVQAAAERFAEVRLITNGRILARTAGDLASSGLSGVEVSLDAATSSAFDKITQTTGYFHGVVAGIEASLRTGLDVQINTVLLADHVDEVPELLRLAESFGQPIVVKLLELVYYDFPGYEYWERNFVDPTTLLPYLRARAQAVAWEHPPGGFGSPMRRFQLSDTTSVVVKDGLVGTTYSKLCDGCPAYPCQDGLYGLTLTESGAFKFCKHREDLNVEVACDTTQDVIADAARSAVDRVVDAYASATFVSTGWTPAHAERQAIYASHAPSPSVRDWYRREALIPTETRRRLGLTDNGTDTVNPAVSTKD